MRVESDPRATAMLPSDLLEELRSTREDQARRTERMLRESAEMDAALRVAGVDALFIKGHCLAQVWYGDLELRHQWDVDLLVRHRDFARTVDVLGARGFGGVDRGRLDAILGRRPDAWHAISLDRDGFSVDLHWTLRGRSLERIDEEHLWTTRRVLRVEGLELETLSVEDTLVHLLTSIAQDLRRGALRGKLWLDLHLALRALGASVDWEQFLARRSQDGLLTIAVNVLDLYLRLWGRRSSPRALAQALEPHARRVVAADDAAALALVSRPRHAPENRQWFARLRAGPPDRRWPWRRTRRRPALPGLPPALAALLAGGGLAALRTKGVTRLPGAHPRGRSYWIRLSDGRELKGRVLPDEARAAALERWLPHLPTAGFPRLLAREGVATLEEWRAGGPCRRDDAALPEAAGALLGEIHAAVDREPLAPDADRLAAWLQEVERRIAALQRTDLLGETRAARIREALREGRPGTATWGLQHGDFRPESLVSDGRTLQCVDNATIGPGLLEADLARTFCRWPLTAEQRERFLAGYRKHADPGGFEEHERFWTMAAALLAAEAVPGAGGPAGDAARRLLEAHVP